MALADGFCLLLCVYVLPFAGLLRSGKAGADRRSASRPARLAQVEEMSSEPFTIIKTRDSRISTVPSFAVFSCFFCGCFLFWGGWWLGVEYVELGLGVFRFLGGDLMVACWLTEALLVQYRDVQPVFSTSIRFFLGF